MKWSERGTWDEYYKNTKPRSGIDFLQQFRIESEFNEPIKRFLDGALLGIDTGILDIGAGPLSGTYLDDGKRYTRVDFSPHAFFFNVPNADSAVAQAVSLPFSDRSFDAVLSKGVYGYQSQPNRMIQEMIRVLRPGGVFILIDDEADVPCGEINKAVDFQPEVLAMEIARLGIAWVRVHKLKEMFATIKGKEVRGTMTAIVGMKHMSNRERLERYRGHDNYFLHGRRLIREVMGNIPSVSVLDYGAGAVALSSGYFHFASLQKHQPPVVAYDPQAYIVRIPDDSADTLWTNQEPVGHQFDLIVCNFSLHHIEDSPHSVVAGFSRFKPKLVAIFDYDFASLPAGDAARVFVESFTSKREEYELMQMFGGDVRACLDYHRRWGIDDFRRALTKNGYSIRHEEFGERAAAHKFILIGEKVR